MYKLRDATGLFGCGLQQPAWAKQRPRCPILVAESTVWQASDK